MVEYYVNPISRKKNFGQWGECQKFNSKNKRFLTSICHKNNKIIPRQRQKRCSNTKCKTYTQSNVDENNYMKRKLKKFRINYYLIPLVFDLLHSLFCCKFWFFQTLNIYIYIYIQSCDFLSKPCRCRCHHFKTIIGHVPRLQGMWKTWSKVLYHLR